MSPDSRQWFFLVILLVSAWLVYLLAPVITPFAIAAAIAYLGDPLVDRLEGLKVIRWSISRTLAVVFVFLLIALLITVCLLIMVPLLREQLQHLVEKIPGILEWVGTTAIPWLQETLGFTMPALDPMSLTESLKQYWREFSTAALSVLGTVSRSGQVLLNWAMNLVLVPVVSFYLLRDWDRLMDGIRRLMPRRLEPKLMTLAAEIHEVLGSFIRGQLLVMLALGLIYSIGLWAIGLELAFIIGLAAGLLSVVPYLGTIVGLGAAVIAGLFQFQDPLHIVLILAVFGAGQALEGMVLTPKLVGDRVGLHPVAVIFSVLAGGQLFGFLGILLALPVASVEQYLPG
jgi:predicted PurR-regulated permease PerM